TDYEDEEIERKITMSVKFAFCEWNKNKINMLDTPGFGNFIQEARGALRVADAAIVVVDAVSGAMVQTEKAWAYADEFGLPRFVVVNRMDRDTAAVERDSEFGAGCHCARNCYGKGYARQRHPAKDRGYRAVLCFRFQDVFGSLYRPHLAFPCVFRDVDDGIAAIQYQPRRDRAFRLHRSPAREDSGSGSETSRRRPRSCCEAEGNANRRHSVRQSPFDYVSRCEVDRAGYFIRHRAEVPRRRGKNQHRNS